MNDDMPPLISEDLVLCLDALALIVCESNEAEVIRVALAALINTEGGPQQLRSRGLAI